MKLPPGVTIPVRIAALPRDERGYPVPFFAAIIDGKPDLRVSSPTASRDCHEKQLCWVCGQKLGHSTSFIGGPLSYQSGVYADGPMHRDCAEFSLAVCPYLALPNSKRRDNNLPDTVQPAEGAAPEKPDEFLMVVVQTGDWEYHRDKHLFKRNRLRAVRRWKDGKEL